MTKTILTIDDSASVRQMVALTLSAAGHNVIEASWQALVDALTFGLRRHGA